MQYPMTKGAARNRGITVFSGIKIFLKAGAKRPLSKIFLGFKSAQSTVDDVSSLAGLTSIDS